MAECTVESSEVVLNLDEKKPIKVLLVDDEAGLLKIARQCLEMEGQFQVDSALSADEAMEKVKRKSFDAVVSDYQMPGKDGLEFLKELRQSGNAIPFIVFTGRGREEVAIKALNWGADQYLSKGDDPETVYYELAHGIRTSVERRKALAQLAYQAQLVQNVSDAIIATDKNFIITSWNRAAENMYGWRADEILGKPGDKILGLRFIGTDHSEAAEAFEKTGRFRGELAQRRKSGEMIYVEITSMALLGRNGEVEGYVCVNRDVTERKKMESALFENHARLQNILAASPDAITVTDLDGNIIDCNRAALNLYGGSSKDDLIGKNALTLVAKKDQPKAIEKMKETVEKGSVKDLMYALVTKDGREYQAELSSSLVRDSSGNPVGFVAIIRDMTERKKAEEKVRESEEKVRESEEKYRELFENARDVIMTFDLDGNVTSANRAIVDYGYRKEELIGESMFKFISEEYWPRLHSDLEQLAQGSAVRNEIAIITPHGKRIAEYTSNPIIRHGGIVGFQTILRDVTDRKNAEESLRVCSEKYEKLLESTVEGVIISGADGKISSANPAAAAILGYSSPKELVGMKAAELYVDHKQRRVLLEQLEEKGYVQGFEVALKRKDNTQVCIQADITVRKDIEGNTPRTENVFKEIPQHERIEEELRDLRERLDVLFEHAPDAYYLNDLKGTFIAGNKAAEELTGYNRAELIGKSFLKLKLLPRGQMPKAAKLLAMNALGKPTGPDEFTLNQKDGTQVQVEIRTFPAKIKGKNMVLGIARDITERKKIENALRRSEEELRCFSSAVKSSRDGIVMSDLNGRITELNDAALRLYGANEKTDLIGKSSLDIVCPEERGRIMENMREVMAKGYAECKEINVLTRSGARAPVEITTTLVKDIEGHPVGFLGIVRDLTERKNAEKAILENQQKFEGLFTGNPEATVYLDQDFHILDVNPRFTSLFGYSRDEVKGKRLNHIVVPKNHMSEAEMLDSQAREGYVYYDTVRTKKDGSLVPVSISAAPIFIQGQLAGYIGVYKDISEQKSAEEKLAMMNEKLRVVGGLTRHDARNKLSLITGNAYLIKKELTGESKVLGYLREMETAVQQVIRIFDFARAYEMLGVEELTYIDVEKTVNEAISLFSDPRGIKVINDCHGLTVLADSLLQQLFYNLIDNSLKYGEKVKRITVCYEKNRENELKFVYEDDGVGIGAAEKSKLFNEGYTTGKGSGYGLYLVKKMMEVYGWTIQETGEQGKGAQFVITIPKMNSRGKENYRIA